MYLKRKPVTDKIEKNILRWNNDLSGFDNARFKLGICFADTMETMIIMIKHEAKILVIINDIIKFPEQSPLCWILSESAMFKTNLWGAGFVVR